MPVPHLSRARAVSSGRFRKLPWGPYFNSSDGTCWLMQQAAAQYVPVIHTSIFLKLVFLPTCRQAPKKIKVKDIKLPLCLNTTPWSTKGGVEVKLHAFLTLALNTDELPLSRSGCFPSDTHLIEGRVDHRSVWTLLRAERSHPFRESNFGRPTYSQ